jgi:hypothetical protein
MNVQDLDSVSSSQRMNVSAWGDHLYRVHQAALAPHYHSGFESLLAAGEGWLVALDIVEWLLEEGRLSPADRATAIEFAESGAFSKFSSRVLEELLEQHVSA